jgi:hypothetical protein
MRFRDLCTHEAEARVKRFIDDAAANAITDQAIEFTSQMQAAFARYGLDAFVSDAQLDWLEQLAGYALPVV